ncbi:MAG: glycosyltransferase family 2 protein [Lachnospiraceae bacterium]|nr:glycosyltransferase family 2 protein [Lachnospiraceae bacterium]MDY4617710.1 glycosyltransferase family 2 protein [Lachnospiraceae bacterium]
MTQPLVSVLIPTYKSFEGIYKTLNSIFSQTYSNIEIVINDDGSPNYGEYESKIAKYIEEHKTPNISNVIFQHLEENVGTTQNCNSAIKVAKGKYLKAVPVDDELYDETVISKCVEFCEKNQARILVGQTFVKRRTGEDTDKVRNTASYRWKARSGRMCNITPTPKDIQYLKSLDTKTCNELLMSRCIISTVAVFFSMELLRETNGFLEDFRLIEDMTYWPYLAKKGEKFFFSEIIMMKYALNGVSNGGPLNSEFFRDYQIIMKEIYIKNEVRGGIFNPALKRLRNRQIDWMRVSRENNSIGNKLKYLDVICYQFWGNIKYLLAGTRL